MKTFALALILLGCPNPKVENRSGLAWTDFDTFVLSRNIRRCEEKYKNSPCLKLFRKVGDRAYHALCGRNEENGRVETQKENPCNSR